MAGSRRRNRDRHPAATTAPPEFLREPPTPVKAGKQGELSFSPPMFVCKLLYIIRLERFPAYTNRGAGDAVQGAQLVYQGANRVERFRHPIIA